MSLRPFCNRFLEPPFCISCTVYDNSTVADPVTGISGCPKIGVGSFIIDGKLYVITPFIVVSSMVTALLPIVKMRLFPLPVTVNFPVIFVFDVCVMSPADTT